MIDDFATALADASIAIAKEPAAAKYHVRAAKCYTAVGRLSDAARHFRQATALDPDSSGAQEGTTATQCALSDQSEAKKTLAARHFANCLIVLDRVLEVSPAAHAFAAMKAQCMIGLKRMAEATSLIQDILTKSPGNSEALYVRGLYYCQQGRRRARVRVCECA